MKRVSECPKDDCYCRYKFTQDEYLKIPEYYYLQDDTPDHFEYFSFLKNILSHDTTTNSIVEEIFHIMPHHIITTNYDTLLEKSNAINARLYSVVAKDKDMLSKASARYIVKMHGDLEKLESIVLKETDYIEYEQTHPLITTYIKSLLIDHTFLFIGYSLNDYNLKFIIGWINYLCQKYDVHSRPRNFILSASSPVSYEVERLRKSNIFVIDPNAIPCNKSEVMIPSNLTDPAGKRVFSYLPYLSNSSLMHNVIPLIDILNREYQVLKSYAKISHEDLRGTN